MQLLGVGGTDWKLNDADPFGNGDQSPLDDMNKAQAHRDVTVVLVGSDQQVRLGRLGWSVRAGMSRRAGRAVLWAVSRARICAPPAPAHSSDSC